MQHLRVILFAVVVGLLLTGVALAGAPAQLDRHVIAGGGATVTDGDHFILSGTLGEPVVSDLSGVDPRAAAGFWQDLSPDGEIEMPAVYNDD